MACEAVNKGKVKRRGRPSIEFYYAGRPHYYCFGYIDKMTDELLDVCRKCKSNVIYAQEDFDALNGRADNVRIL